MYTVWFPQMYKAGISYDEFGRMTMKQMNVVANAYSERLDAQLEYDNILAYIQGQYFSQAIMCTVGNMFKGKGQKAFEYPSKPFELKNHELSEDEIQAQRVAFMESLKVMQRNFELNQEVKG